MRRVKVNVHVTMDFNLEEKGLTEEQKAAVVSERVLHVLAHSIVALGTTHIVHDSESDCFETSVSENGDVAINFHCDKRLANLVLKEISPLLNAEIERAHRSMDKPILNVDMASNILSKFLVGKD